MIPVHLSGSSDSFTSDACPTCGRRWSATMVRGVVSLTAHHPGDELGDDAWVWGRLVGASTSSDCWCATVEDRWRFAPAIPAASQVGGSSDRDQLAEAGSAWHRAGFGAVAAWALPAELIALASRASEQRGVAAGSLVALAAWAVGDDGSGTTWAGLDLAEASAPELTELLEWARAGVRSAAEADRWLVAGASDSHDAACRAQAGETADALDPGRTGCHALSARWPGLRPATTTCAHRAGATTSALSRLVVDTPGGVQVHIDGDQPCDERLISTTVVSTIARTGRPLSPLRLVLHHRLAVPTWHPSGSARPLVASAR